MEEDGLGLAAAALAGLASFFSPCVLPLLPSYLSVVTGLSFDELSKGRGKGRLLSCSLAFVLGFSAVFVALGAAASVVGAFLGEHRAALERAAGFLIVLFGLAIVVSRWTPLPLLSSERRVHWARGGSVFLAAVAGAAFGLGWTPCVGPALGSILALAAAGGSVERGVALLAAYSLGLAVPFVAFALTLGALARLLRRAGRVLGWFQTAAGAVLVAVGVLLLTGRFAEISARAMGLF